MQKKLNVQQFVHLTAKIPFPRWTGKTRRSFWSRTYIILKTLTVQIIAIEDKVILVR